MIGVQFEPGVSAAEVRAACERRGLLVLTAKDRLRLLPPRYLRVHPAWLKAVTEQAGLVQHTSNLYYTAPLRAAGTAAVPAHRAGPGVFRQFRCRGQ